MPRCSSRWSCIATRAGASPAALLVAGAEPAAVPWLAARFGPPGVHLHRSRAAALPGLVRRHIAASSTASGWGLYAAEMVRDHGLSPEPASRLVERVHFLIAAHLAVADLGVHTRQFTSADAIGYLTTRLPVDRAFAETLVRGIACRPLTAAAAGFSASGNWYACGMMCETFGDRASRSTHSMTKYWPTVISGPADPLGHGLDD